MYIHDLSEWPRFTLNLELLAEPLASVRHRQGRLTGRMEALGFSLRQEAVLQTLTADVLKSSEIEGEKLDAGQVRSSIARRLGIDIGALKPADRNVDGVVEMILDATRRYEERLDAERLYGWHAALFPTGRSGMSKIRIGTCRNDSTGPMEVVSGPMGKERIHFVAPQAGRLDWEMQAFLDWFNAGTGIDPVLKAGLAHLWFVTIHPFDDGNGRIARAIADLALARSENSPQRFYSMSAQIRQERNAYYDILEQTQKGTMDVTHWMEWFLGCLGRAIDGAQTILGSVLAKARFWESFATIPLNDRQRLVLNRLLDGSEGKLTTSKYAKLAKCSQDTALRDILPLVERGILVRNPKGGRSTSYAACCDPTNRELINTIFIAPAGT
ncbi:MAG: Fic family protein [Acidobacteriia bacterium]|nr:Fic family protein [Terriglobia bacterium]